MCADTWRPRSHGEAATSVPKEAPERTRIDLIFVGLQTWRWFRDCVVGALRCKKTLQPSERAAETQLNPKRNNKGKVRTNKNKQQEIELGSQTWKDRKNTERLTSRKQKKKQQGSSKQLGLEAVDKERSNKSNTVECQRKKVEDQNSSMQLGVEAANKGLETSLRAPTYYNKGIERKSTKNKQP